MANQTTVPPTVRQSRRRARHCNDVFRREGQEAQGYWRRPRSQLQGRAQLGRSCKIIDSRQRRRRARRRGRRSNHDGSISQGHQDRRRHLHHWIHRRSVKESTKVPRLPEQHLHRQRTVGRIAAADGGYEPGDRGQRHPSHGG